jgi:hypothetical protein
MYASKLVKRLGQRFESARRLFLFRSFAGKTPEFIEASVWNEANVLQPAREALSVTGSVMAERIDLTVKTRCSGSAEEWAFS